MPRAGKEHTPKRRDLDTNQKKTAPSSEEGAGQKKRRFKPGTVARREVIKYQKEDKCHVRFQPFVRQVRGILTSSHFKERCFGKPVDALRFEKSAMLRLRDAYQSVIVKSFTKANIVAAHAKRTTVMPKDIATVTKLESL